MIKGSNKVKEVRMSLKQHTESWIKFGFLNIEFSPETIDEDPIGQSSHVGRVVAELTSGA